MAQLGLDLIDRTVQDTHALLNDVMEGLGTEHKPEAYHALRAVLTTLRDRLPPDHAAGFGAQLSTLVRGLYYEGFRPADLPRPWRTLDAWTAEVGARMDVPDAPDAGAATRAVFAALPNHVDDALCRKVFDALPEPVRALWSGLSEEAAHQH